MPRRSGDRGARVRASQETTGAQGAGGGSGRCAEEDRAGDDVPGAARRRRADQAVVLRGDGRPRSGRRRRHPDSAAQRTRHADLRSAQPPHLLRRAGEGAPRLRALHGDDRRAHARQHADQPGGGAERVPRGERSRRSRRRRRGPRRREGGRADRQGIDHGAGPGRRAGGQPAGREARGRAHRRPGHLYPARPADRRRQQRDAGISAGPAAQAGQGAGRAR